MKGLGTFWCGWSADDDIPDEHMVAQWPEGMHGWRTGSGGGYITLVARVDASDAADAERIVRGCYGKSGSRMRMRWEPERHVLGWRPGARFQEPARGAKQNDHDDGGGAE